MEPPWDLNLMEKCTTTINVEEYSKLVYSVIDDHCVIEAPNQANCAVGANVCDFTFMSFTALDQEDQLLANCIINEGRPNSIGLQVPLKTNWNLKLFSSLCIS